jgi:hypothetical protein
MGLAAMSISTRFAVVFLVAMALVGAAHYLILDRIYLDQLKSRAEIIAAFLLASSVQLAIDRLGDDHALVSTAPTPARHER